MKGKIMKTADAESLYGLFPYATKYGEISEAVRKLSVGESYPWPIPKGEDATKVIQYIRCLPLFKEDARLIARLSTDRKTVVVSKYPYPRLRSVVAKSRKNPSQNSRKS